MNILNNHELKYLFVFGSFAAFTIADRDFPRGGNY